MIRRRSALQDRIAAGILDTAAAVLAERGDQVSMAEIARAAGVGRATLYRYFPTRDALLQGLVGASFEELRARVAAAELDTVDVQDGVARLARSFLAAGSKYAALGHLSKEHSHQDELDQHVAEPVRRLLRRGIADGTFRGDLSAEVLFEMFGGLLEKSLRLVLRKQFGIEQASAAAVTVFLTGTTKVHNGHS